MIVQHKAFIVFLLATVFTVHIYKFIIKVNITGTTVMSFFTQRPNRYQVFLKSERTLKLYREKLN